MMTAVLAGFVFGLLASLLLDIFFAEIKQMVQKEVALSLSRAVSAKEK